MTEKHLTDSEIQQLAFEPDRQAATMLNHLHTCPSCASRLEFYTQHFSSLRQIPKPAFDFDLSALVMGQIQQKTRLPKRLFQIIVFIALAVGTSFLTHWVFRKYLHQLFTG